MPTSSKFSVNKFLQLNQRGVIPILTLVLILIGIFGTVYLVRNAPLVFKPKAAANVLDIQVSSGKDAAGNPCLLSKDEANGRWRINCREVKLSILSPADVGAGVTAPAPAAATGCVDNPVDPLPGYKWVADCSKSCQTNDNCPKNSVQGPTGFVCPATSNQCYDFGGSIGQKCLMLEYIGPKTGGPVGLHSNQQCADKTKLTYSCITGPAGSITTEQADCVIKAKPDILKTYTDKTWCNTKDNQRAIVNNWINNVATATDKNDSKIKACLPTAAAQTSNDTLQFVVAESEGELQTNSWENYTPGGVVKVYALTPPPTVSQTRYIYLRFRQGSAVIGQNQYVAVVEYIAPAGSGTGASNPGSTGTPTPQADNRPFSAQITITPNPVQKNASGYYPEIGIRVKNATKAWTLYYNNKEGANCGRSSGCNAKDDWTPFTAISNTVGGSGQANQEDLVTWTPLTQLKGTHTIAIVDTNSNQVISPVDLVFQDTAVSSGFISKIQPNSECSEYVTKTVCGGGKETYDYCIDDKQQSGSTLCANGATKFYCVGSTNRNCDSRAYKDGSLYRTAEGSYQYTCASCPNLNGYDYNSN